MIDFSQERWTGRELRALRAYYGILQADIARAWPCSRNNVGRVELARRPGRLATERYLAALVRLIER